MASQLCAPFTTTVGLDLVGANLSPEAGILANGDAGNCCDHCASHPDGCKGFVLFQSRCYFKSVYTEDGTGCASCEAFELISPPPPASPQPPSLPPLPPLPPPQSPSPPCPPSPPVPPPSPPSLPPPPACQTFGFMNNTELAGGDITGTLAAYNLEPSESIDLCCDLCSAEDACAGFVEFGRACYFKGVGAQLENKEERNAYFLPSMASKWPSPPPISPPPNPAMPPSPPPPCPDGRVMVSSPRPPPSPLPRPRPCPHPHRCPRPLPRPGERRRLPAVRGMPCGLLVQRGQLPAAIALLERERGVQ